jgi:succinoglycan biosynthesis protein ExoA
MNISVIVPCRNERGFISDFINHVFAQELGELSIELIIADGMSNDGTFEYLIELQNLLPNLKVLRNEGRIVSTGLNLALNNSEGDIVVRMDVHTTYEKNYIQECVKTLLTTNANCVGGAWIATGTSPVQIAVANAFQSRVASGGALSRSKDYDGWVDTVYLGAWRRNYILSLGGFDENLVRNQDDELSLRIIQSGGKIWQSSKIKSKYTPRNSLTSVFNQFFQYGYWRLRVIKKHKHAASFRHVAPFGFLVLLTSLLILSCFNSIALVALLFVLCLYSIIIVVDLIINSKIKGLIFHHYILSFICVLLMHLGYSLGFGLAVIDAILGGSNLRDSVVKLTR